MVAEVGNQHDTECRDAVVRAVADGLSRLYCGHGGAGANFSAKACWRMGRS